MNVDGKKLRINTKPGTYDGQVLRIKGKGAAGDGGGQKGDIYLKIRVHPDKEFQLDGHNVIKDIPVDIYTAVLGGKIKVKTLAGVINVSVPKGTQPGNMLRLRGKGMPYNGESGEYGDFLLKLKVEIPKHLTEEEERLFEQLKGLNQKK